MTAPRSLLRSLIRSALRGLRSTPAQHGGRAWGPWLVAPGALLVVTELLAWHGLQRCRDTPCIAVFFFSFALIAANALLSLLLALLCRQRTPWQRYLGRTLYGISLGAQVCLFLFLLPVLA